MDEVEVEELRANMLARFVFNELSRQREAVYFVLAEEHGFSDEQLKTFCEAVTAREAEQHPLPVELCPKCGKLARLILGFSWCENCNKPPGAGSN